MEIPPQTLTRLLEEMADWLAFEECGPVEWVVCGGVALALQNLNVRTTRDVDVLGQWNPGEMTIHCLDDFPDKVKACIRRVTENHPELAGLGERWINLGPGRLARLGLPKGFEKRLTTVRFKDHLTLYLLGRQDLMALKLYAAADGFGSRQAIHFQDLQSLHPTFDELDFALDWVRTLPDFEEKRPEIKHVLERLGHDDLAYYL